MLCNEFDPDRKALINPEEHLSPIPGFPEICILAFSSHIVEKCLERYGGEQIAHVPFCTGPVSYTHLDVYKRQGGREGSSKLPPSKTSPSWAASKETHTASAASVKSR